MAKQICFFATPNDLQQLFGEILLKNYIFIDQYGHKQTMENLMLFANDDFCAKTYAKCNFYLSTKNSAICYLTNNDYRCIDYIKSDVIQIAACSQLPKQIVDTSIIDNRFKKNGFIIIDDQTEYYRQLSEYMENPIYIDNPNYIENGFECGRIAFANNYYDDYGNKVNKSKEISSLYSFLQKHIKNHYKLSKDKFGYIGADAYREYLEGNFIPCSGKIRICFD